ncbi:hypothetical protein FZ934_12665 [Rhizobium grahamii]|uniref:Transmembrane protein n=1 Tax=Rhizobium grahamii TaxID=1120045 RepID=A0A5Q0CAH3_9HYPH|nr:MULTISPECIES: hypothetical protein [Rhizobium]QFY62453.1 hypothetical protein FZ934_12665 [Rhizobium grahamii]QRM51359.1 hypothetical protein F3Y33_10225 [Rhizobium sp. BG6]
MLVLVTAGGTAAHQRTADGPHTGIAVPEISHGEMIMIAEYRSRIIDLAARAVDTNEPFRRVLNFAEIQYAYCLWGRVLGSVTDEASPFNECAHAYLAATKAVLLMMRTMKGEAETAEAIVSEVDAGMVQRGLALITCEFSGEAFNTADIIRPRWSAVPTHLASLTTLVGLAGISGLLVVGVLAMLRRAATPQRQT